VGSRFCVSCQDQLPVEAEKTEVGGLLVWHTLDTVVSASGVRSSLDNCAYCK
jgi:hypothetical protein